MPVGKMAILHIFSICNTNCLVKVKNETPPGTRLRQDLCQVSYGMDGHRWLSNKTSEIHIFQANRTIFISSFVNSQVTNNWSLINYKFTI